MTSDARPIRNASCPEEGAAVRCACCGAAVSRDEVKACATCGKSTCPACTGWYGHFMLVCADCRLEPW